ncbi:MAG: large conductance mechanosensitive channel [Candidatus Parcubacteria bacterium]|jgi:large conductance mechanosensitive channel|nr:large conductance mechanosensitive channel [Candidatus Parcubacteria bacterium]
MKSFLEEFKTFALRGNVVDLAVGVVIGAAFTAVTNSLVTNVLTPPIGLLMGGIDFSKLGIELGGDAVIAYGLFIQAVVNLLITALALFLFVRFINRLVRLAREERQDGAVAPEQKSPELEVLEEIRDLIVNR